MSALDRPTIEQAEETISKAENMLSDICLGRKCFEMNVPVRDDDPDIVIGDAFYIARLLHTELAASQAREAKLREKLDKRNG